MDKGTDLSLLRRDILATQSIYLHTIATDFVAASAICDVLSAIRYYERASGEFVVFIPYGDSAPADERFPVGHAA